MAIGSITVTDAWQEAATGAVTITVEKQGDDTLLFNETGTDVNALGSRPKPGEQFIQNDAVSTFVRSEGDGWVLRLDGTL